MTSANDIRISRSEQNNKGEYEAEVRGISEKGVLTYSRMSAEAVIADHTAVPQELRGHQVGIALVERLIADARAEGFRIVPLCPFVNAQFARHPEWADVMMK